MKPSVLVFALLSGILAVYAAMSYRRVTAPVEHPAAAGAVGAPPVRGSHGASMDLAAAHLGSPSDTGHGTLAAQPGKADDEEDPDDKDDEKDETAPSKTSAKPTVQQPQPKVQVAAHPSAPPPKYTLNDPVDTKDPAYVPILVQAYGGAATAKLQSIINGDYDRSLRLQAVDGLAQILKTGGAGTVPLPAPVVVGTDPSNTGGSPDDSGDNSGGGNGGPNGGAPPTPVNVPLTMLHDVAMGDPNPAVRQEAWKQLVDLQNNSQGKVTLYKEALVSENGKLSSGSSSIKRWAKIQLKAVGVLR